MKNDTPNAFAKNLSQLISQQKKRENEVPFYLKFVDPLTQFFGSVGFLWLNVIGFLIWIAVNTGILRLVPKFDPYPFEFLTFSVSLEAIVLSIIVLIAQNKLQRDSDERSLLDLHINLLAESETTLILRKLERIEKQLKIETDPEEDRRVKDLIKDTQPEKLAELIHATFCKKEKK